MRTRHDVATQVIMCDRCELHTRCLSPVAFSAPDTKPTIAVLGEAPGETEDARGLPFIGPAGQHLRAALSDVGLHPDAMAYLNTVCCFPHGTPTPEHIEACADNKKDQLDVLDPTFVLVLGSVALRSTKRVLSIRHGRGRPFMIDERCYFATYHPSAALRNGTYDKAMRADLERFATLVSFERHNWMKMIPDSCSACPIEAEWWEPSGLGWCPLHVPDYQREEYEARQRLLAEDLDRLRRAASEVS